MRLASYNVENLFDRAKIMNQTTDGVARDVLKNFAELNALPCVVSCAGLEVDAVARRVKIGATLIAEGDWLSIDGDTGEVFLGQREIVAECPEAALAAIDTWRAGASQKDETALALVE
jgi:hypothetical protein